MATPSGVRLETLHDAYVRTHARLWRSVLAWSGSRDVADEACAEAFAQAARRGAACATSMPGCGGRHFASPPEN